MLWEPTEASQGQVLARHAVWAIIRTAQAISIAFNAPLGSMVSVDLLALRAPQEHMQVTWASQPAPHAALVIIRTARGTITAFSAAPEQFLRARPQRAHHARPGGLHLMRA